MRKFCPNCGEEFDSSSAFCSFCGTKLQEKSLPVSPNINIGDANAISGGLHYSDSHDVENIDQRVINTKSVSNITNNVTQYATKSELEILQEKKTIFLKACQEAYEDNILEQSEILELEYLRLHLGLEKQIADQILESVRQITISRNMTTELSGIAKIKYKRFVSAIENNEVEFLKQQLNTISTLCTKCYNEDLLSAYYLVLSALDPVECISLYEKTKTDNYWHAYWVYFAYLNLGDNAKAESVLYYLDDRYKNYPSENLSLLAAAGTYILSGRKRAKDYLSSLSGQYSQSLELMANTLFVLAEPQIAKEIGADANKCRFYINHVIHPNISDYNIENQDTEEEYVYDDKLADVEIQLADEAFNCKDYSSAIKVYRKYANVRNAYAQYRLAVCFDNGYCVNQNLEQATIWFSNAAQNGSVEAQVECAKRLQLGKGCEKNLEAAAVWYQEAANKKNPEAIYKLGLMYISGQGIPQDDNRGQRLIDAACKFGWGPAIEYRKRMRAIINELKPELNNNSLIDIMAKLTFLGAAGKRVVAKTEVTPLGHYGHNISSSMVINITNNQQSDTYCLLDDFCSDESGDHSYRVTLTIAYAKEILSSASAIIEFKAKVSLFGSKSCVIKN